MAPQDAPFYPEIQALDEYFAQFYFAFQQDWLERGQINFEAVQSLWDIINNVYDNLDAQGISLESMKAALEIIEEMNTLVADILNNGDATDAGIIFSGTREEYERTGIALMDKLYQLEVPISLSKQLLIDMANRF
jgi:hypothetical protein